MILQEMTIWKLHGVLLNIRYVCRGETFQ